MREMIIITCITSAILIFFFGYAVACLMCLQKINSIYSAPIGDRDMTDEEAKYIREQIPISDLYYPEQIEDEILRWGCQVVRNG